MIFDAIAQLITELFPDSLLRKYKFVKRSFWWFLALVLLGTLLFEIAR